MKKLSLMSLVLVVAMLFAMMIPVSAAATTIDQESLNVAVNGAAVSVSGKVLNAVDNQQVTVLVIDKDIDLETAETADIEAAIAYIDQVTANADGTYAYSFTMPDGANNADYVIMHGGSSIEIAGQDSRPLVGEGGEGAAVTGKILLDVDNKQQATATLKTSYKGTEVATVNVAADGTYSFAEVAEGTYVLVLEKAGYLTRYSTVTVAGATTIEDKALVAGELKKEEGKPGLVNLSDLSELLTSWNKAVADDAYIAAADWVDAGNLVALPDLGILIANFNAAEDDYGEVVDKEN